MASKQLVLDLGVETQRDVNGIEMGVLENGIAYLTQRGLAALCGSGNNNISDLTKEWEENFENEVITKDRVSFLKTYLFERGYFEPRLYIEFKKDGVVNYAYPDIVCMAILEWYSFESKRKNEVALANYRAMANYGIKKYIYDSLNYHPDDSWKYHTDRVSILQNSSPDGYFIIFKEVTGMIVDLIKAELTVNHKTIPDISVGRLWSGFWEEISGDQSFGSRIKFAHNYPDYYPQADSNPQMAWAYPDSALAEFRRWFREVYLPTRFPKYILTKAKTLPGGKDEAVKIAHMYQPKKIE